MRDICTGSKRLVDMAERTGRGGLIDDHTPYASIIPPTVNFECRLNSFNTGKKAVAH